MAETIDTLVVRIEADMNDMRRALRRVEGDVSKSTSKMSGAFGKLGKVMKVALAAVAIRQAFRAGKAMIDLASDIEEMEGKSKVVFGQFRANVVKELEEFGNAVGRSTHELEGMASTVQDTFVPMGFARGEAAKLSVELTKLAVDTASFNNASDVDTIKAFQSALVGNHETVRRFGVVITEATLNQELLNMGIEGGNKAATNAQKVQARLNLITDGVKDAQGDAARTAESYANQMKGLKGEFEELVGELGEKFLPIMVKIIKKLREATEKTKSFLRAMGILKLPLADALIDVTAKLKEAQDQVEKFEKRKIPKLKPDGTAYEGTLFDSAFSEGELSDAKARVKELGIERNKLLEKTMPNIDDAKNRRTNLSIKKKADVDPDAEERAKQREDAAALLKSTNAQAELELHYHNAKMGMNAKEIRMERGALIHAKLKDQFGLMAPKNLADLTMATLKAEIAQENYNEALDAQNKGIESGVAFVDSMATEKEKLIELQRDLTEAHHHGAITTDELNAAHKRLAEELLLLDPIYANLVDMSNQAFDKMSNDLADMAMSGKFSLDTLKDTFKNTMKEMVREAIKTYIIKQMLSSMFAGIGGAIGGPVGGFIGKIGNSASGGSLSAGQPQIVGERGAELIVPKSASTVLNHHNTKNAMSGGNGAVVNQTINVDAGVSQTVRAEMLNLLPRIKQDTLNAVIDSKNRGGSFSKAFA
jgi:hypothetical protein